MSKSEVLGLYKVLIRESKKFSSYNFRNYAVRKVRDGFRENSNASGEKVKELLEEGHRNLEIIKRQALIGKMYKTNKLVIENIDRNI